MTQVLTARSLGEIIGEPDDTLRMRVEAWDCDVCYRPLTGMLVTKLGAIAADEDGDDRAWLDLVPEILQQCVVDEEGNRVFTKRRVEQLLAHRHHAAPAMEVVQAVIAATRLDEPTEDVEGN